MKKLFSLLFLCILIIPGVTLAQEIKIDADLQKEVPVDSKVLIGKLDNGLTYYIRQNEKPEDKVELRLVVNAGSMQENEKQLGLAHFTEHMAFNGSENFEKNELVKYLQSVGVKFGADLNAYTSFDETVYILPIPSDDEEILNTGLQVLDDWAQGVTMTDEEIDKERGVVIEEWRLGQGAQQRMRDEYFPLLFKNSRYAERLPIGKKEILENFDYKTIRNFYKDWYRPDLMAVIAVGDIDPAQMEEKIKNQFGDLENPKNAPKREFYEVPNHEETYVSIVTDKEAPYTNIQLLIKNETLKTETQEEFRRDLVHSLYNGLMGKRLNELKEQANPPYFYAATSYSSMVRTKSAYSSFAVVGDNGALRGLEVLLEENERVKRHGFTQGELDRYKKELLNFYEKAYNERGKSESNRYAGEYVRAFLTDERIPGIEYEYAFAQKVLPTVSLDEINQLATDWIKDENRVVIVQGPEKEGNTMPEKDEILNLMKEVEQREIEPYEDSFTGAALMENIPNPGKVVSSSSNETVGITELKLSNGATVVLKPTDFKNDEILMSAYSFGGHSLYEDEDYFSASYASDLINEAGIRDFSKTDLQKLLSDKNVSVSPYISSLSEGLSGSSVPRDAETMFQLLNLYFTAPRKDTETFESFKNKNSMLFQNLLASPNYYFSDKVANIMSQGHLRGGGIPKVEDLEKIDYDRLFEIYKERFSNAGDFTFFFVGNFTIEDIKPLIERYIASLPGKDSSEKWEDRGLRPPSGNVEEIINKGKDPKSMVNIFFTDEAKLSSEEKYWLSSLGEVLTNRLIENLREEKGGVYGVGASGSASQYPYDSYTFRISFPCSPDNAESLIEASYDEIKDIQKNGISDEDMTKIKETQKRSRKDNLKKNSYWLNQLRSYYFNDKNLDEFYAYDKKIEELTSEDLKNVAKKYLDLENKIEIVLMPEE